MPGVIVNGIEYKIPGIKVVNWKDDPKVRLKIGEDGAKRPFPNVTGIVLHTTLGAPDQDHPHPQTLLPGAGPSTNLGEAIEEMWWNDHRCAGSHLAVDFDGVVYCLADLLLEQSYHATSVNPRTIGIEFKQGTKLSELYDTQLENGRILVDWLTSHFGIQRQIPGKYHNRPLKRLESGAKDFYGVFGHRDQSNNRGVGDPGDFIMDRLISAGYERFDVENKEDITVWVKRQLWLGLTGAAADGIPGPNTVRIMKAQGFTDGLWVLPPAERILPTVK